MENLNQTDICKARYHAANVAESLAVAYWVDGEMKSYHLKSAQESLAALLDVINSGKAE